MLRHEWTGPYSNPSPKGRQRTSNVSGVVSVYGGDTSARLPLYSVKKRKKRTRWFAIY